MPCNESNFVALFSEGQSLTLISECYDSQEFILRHSDKLDDDDDDYDDDDDDDA
jgi:hypothetical protein